MYFFQFFSKSELKYHTLLRQLKSLDPGNSKAFFKNNYLERSLLFQILCKADISKGAILTDDSAPHHHIHPFTVVVMALDAGS